MRVSAHAWAREQLEESWTRYMRSPLRGAASMALMAHELHDRLLLNEHLELGLRGDPGAEILGKSSGWPEELGSPHEAARDRSALAAAVGGNEGQALRGAALARLEALRIPDIDGVLRAYFPEALALGAHGSR